MVMVLRATAIPDNRMDANRIANSGHMIIAEPAWTEVLAFRNVIKSQVRMLAGHVQEVGSTRLGMYVSPPMVFA